MANRVAGVCYVKADGQQYALGGSCTVSPSSVEREGVVGLSGPAGYKETPRVPFVEIEVVTTPDLSIDAVDKLTDATVTAELANGKTYVLRGAWSKAATEINAADGTTSIRFEGLSCEEI